MTHTDADFRRANYFFCDGMNDPWLNEFVVANKFRVMFNLTPVIIDVADCYLDV